MQSLIKPRIIHGTPITPKALLQQLRGENFCVSFHRPEQLEDVLKLQDKNGMLLLDNGAFSHWKTTGGKIDRVAFWKWANAAQARSEVAVAVIPDVIGGTEQENLIEASWAVRGRSALAQFPERVMFCWHMNDSLEQLKTACRLFNFVAIGSCAEYDIQKHKAAYMKRLAQAKAMIDYVELEYGRRPWIHLMRATGVITEALFAQSSDSVNLALNHARLKKDPAKRERRASIMANRIRAQVHGAAARARLAPALHTSNFSDGPTRAPRTLSRLAAQLAAQQQSEVQLKEAA